MSGNFFRADNPYNSFMSKVFDIILINLLWTVCCIPVITIGASTAAMYSVMLRLVRDEEGPIIQSFFDFFRKNFVKSIPYTVIMVLFTLVMILDMHILGQQSSDMASVMYGVTIALMVTGIIVLSYALPLFARFENPPAVQFSNAWRLAVTHIPQSLIILVINSVPIIWLLVSPSTFALIFWVWLLCGTGTATYFDSRIPIVMFDRITRRSDTESE